MYNLEGDLIQNESVSSWVHVFDDYYGSLILASNDNISHYSFCDYEDAFMIYNIETGKCEECTFDNGCILCSAPSTSLDCCSGDAFCYSSAVGIIIGIVIGSLLW